jgi:molecular chaperone IbpA
MRTFDVSPLYRSTIGFDRILDMLNEGAHSNWPPYDIEKKGENEYGITMAVAGFGPDEIEITQHGTQLLVSGQRRGDGAGRQFLHQGIASRAFKQTFRLAEHVRVEAASLENGLLSIDLVREVPERLKPRKIEIASAPTTGAVQDNTAPEPEARPERRAA